MNHTYGILSCYCSIPSELSSDRLHILHFWREFVRHMSLAMPWFPVLIVQGYADCMIQVGILFRFAVSFKVIYSHDRVVWSVYKS